MTHTHTHRELQQARRQEQEAIDRAASVLGKLEFERGQWEQEREARARHQHALEAHSLLIRSQVAQVRWCILVVYLDGHTTEPHTIAPWLLALHSQNPKLP